LPEVILGLGTNMGNRKQNLKKAVKLLSEKIEIKKVSAVYETDPVGYTEQPLFLNMVAAGNTALKPTELLKYLKDIEGSMGRIPSFANAPRPIDIDILFYDEKLVNRKDLVIPHPRLTVRAFVLVPLADIAPDLIHPGNGRKIRSLLTDLGKIEGVHRWGDPGEIWEKDKNV